MWALSGRYAVWSLVVMRTRELAAACFCLLRLPLGAPESSAIVSVGSRSYFGMTLPLLPLDEKGFFALPHVPGGPRNATVALDVGVLRACDFSKQVLADPSFVVIGFEPNYAMVQRQIFVHDRVLLLPVAVSSREGFQTLHVSNHPGCASLSAPAGNYTGKEFTMMGGLMHLSKDCVIAAKDVAVPTISLESVLRRIPPVKKILVKIDAQGYDFEVIKSAGAQLRRVEAAVLETQDAPIGLRLYQSQVPRATIIEFMRRSGFRTHSCQGLSRVARYLGEADCAFCRKAACSLRDWMHDSDVDAIHVTPP